MELDTYLDMRASHFPKGGLRPATSSMPGSTPALIQQRSNMAENVDEDKDDLLVRKGFDYSQGNMIPSIPVPVRKLRVWGYEVMWLTGDLKLSNSKLIKSCMGKTLGLFRLKSCFFTYLDISSYFHNIQPSGWLTLLRKFLLLLGFLQLLLRKKELTGKLNSLAGGRASTISTIFSTSSNGISSACSTESILDSYSSTCREQD